MDEEKRLEQLDQDLSTAETKDLLSTDACFTEEESNTAQTDETETPDSAIEPGEHYVERPKGQRILAWVLFGLVALGVILYYFWLSGVLK